VGLVDLLDAYKQTLAFTGTRVAGTRPAQFGDPTPCSEWDVRALIGHVVTVISHYSALPSGVAHSTATPVDAIADGQHPLVYARLADEALAAWSQPGALERPCHHVMGTMPGGRALSIHTTDLLVHGWDLAVATGQDDSIDPQLADLAVATLRDILRLDKGRGTFFAPALPPPGGDAQSRLLAYAGRVPPVVGGSSPALSWPEQG
jgi:uncharacterized protein (TIGR03086 family)